MINQNLDIAGDADAQYSNKTQKAQNGRGAMCKLY